jgi:hypothetical protein
VLTSRLIRLERKYPSTTEKIRAEYIRAIAANWIYITGIKVINKTKTIIGRKNSPTERLEST